MNPADVAPQTTAEFIDDDDTDTDTEMDADSGQDTEPTDGRAVRWQVHKAERRDRILDAAVEELNESGPELQVTAIALRAEVQRSVVYRLFANRAEIDELLRVRIVARLMAELSPSLNSDGPLMESIETVVRTYVDWIVAHPRLHQFLGRGITRPAAGQSKIVTGTRTAIAMNLAELLRTILRAGGAATELAEPMAFGLIGLVDATVNRWLAHPAAEASADTIKSFLTLSAWQVLEVNFRQAGITLDPRKGVRDYREGVPVPDPAGP